ncbi:MAG: helix-turn-helix domain-containing protein, partial [Bacteroidota bacterium]
MIFVSMASIGKLELSPEDRKELLLRSRSHTLGSRDVLRSRIILLCSEGKSYDSIQDALKISRPVINKWKGRYKQHGIEGLKDAARPGKPRKYQEVDKARVIQLACSNPEG